MNRGLAWSALVVPALLSAPAAASPASWELSEFFQGPDGRYVEIRSPEGGCLYPSSLLRVFDEDLEVVGTAFLTPEARCHAAGTYIVLADAAAETSFGFPADGLWNLALPTSGHLCFVSSQTRYDCVRWGTSGAVLGDLFGANDSSVLGSLALTQSWGRIASTHVVSDDWQLGDPSPRAPNDGTSWIPPDAGVFADATPVDPLPEADAASRRDASSPKDGAPASDRFLDLDPQGGGCGMVRPGGRAWVGIVLIPLLGPLRRTRSPNRGSLA